MLVSFCQKCSAAHYSGKDPNVDKRHARRAFDGLHHCCSVFPVLLGQAILCLRVAVKHDMNSLLTWIFASAMCLNFNWHRMLRYSVGPVLALLTQSIDGCIHSQQ